MQISNNYHSNTNFTGFKVQPKSIDRVMETFENCTTTDLLKHLQLLRREAKNPVKIDLEDLGFYSGQPALGHWEATVGDKVLSNGNMFSVSAYSLKHFLNKVANEAQKLNPKKISADAQKIQNHKDAIELIKLKSQLKNGKDKTAIRDNLLDQIFEIIRVK